MASRIVIAGGSGFIGVSLAALLTSRGDEVTVLSRRALPGAGRGTHG